MNKENNKNRQCFSGKISNSVDVDAMERRNHHRRNEDVISNPWSLLGITEEDIDTVLNDNDLAASTTTTSSRKNMGKRNNRTIRNKNQKTTKRSPNTKRRRDHPTTPSMALKKTKSKEAPTTAATDNDKRKPSSEVTAVPPKLTKYKANRKLPMKTTGQCAAAQDVSRGMRPLPSTHTVQQPQQQGLRRQSLSSILSDDPDADALQSITSSTSFLNHHNNNSSKNSTTGSSNHHDHNGINPKGTSSSSVDHDGTKKEEYSATANNMNHEKTNAVTNPTTISQFTTANTNTETGVVSSAEVSFHDQFCNYSSSYNNHALQLPLKQQYNYGNHHHTSHSSSEQRQHHIYPPQPQSLQRQNHYYHSQNHYSEHPYDRHLQPQPPTPYDNPNHANYMSSELLELQRQYQRSIQRITNSMMQSHRTKWILQRHVTATTCSLRRRSSLTVASSCRISTGGEPIHYWNHGHPPQQRRKSSLQFSNKVIIIPNTTPVEDSDAKNHNHPNFDSMSTDKIHHDHMNSMEPEREQTKSSDTNDCDLNAVTSEDYCTKVQNVENAMDLSTDKNPMDEDVDNHSTTALSDTSGIPLTQRRRNTGDGSNGDDGGSCTGSTSSVSTTKTGTRRDPHRPPQYPNQNWMILEPTTSVDASREMLYHLLHSSNHIHEFMKLS
jgi:hypothetical protein